MADLIDREKFMPILDAHIADMREKYGDNRLCNIAISLVQNQRDFISTVPSVDAERPKGEWIDISQVVTSVDGDWFAEQYKCSLCGRKEYKKEPFCNCGADMRSQQKSLCDQNEKENDDETSVT